MTLRTLIQHNFGWKLLSVLLAALVWWQIKPLTHETRSQRAAAAADSIARKDLKLPVRVMTSAGDARRFSVTPAEITLTLSGPVVALATLKSETLLVYVDVAALGDARSGLVDVHVTASGLVTVEEATPDKVFLERL